MVDACKVPYDEPPYRKLIETWPSAQGHRPEQVVYEMYGLILALHRCRVLEEVGQQWSRALHGFRVIESYAPPSSTKNRRKFSKSLSISQTRTVQQHQI